MGPDWSAHGDAAPFCFGETASAARYEKILRMLPDRAASELPQLLACSANPDQAVVQLEGLLERHGSEALAALESSGQALRAWVLLFGASQWLGQTLLQNPDLLQLFARPTGLEPERRVEDFREQFARFRMRSHETALPVLLARFKRREYVRIFTRELLGLASVAEITGEISALSDVLIERGLEHCESELRRRYQGWPQLRSERGRVYAARFAVLSLGKLGGNELNYSSDVDLLYLYDDAEDAGAIAVTSHEFFTRLAQELTAVLSSVGADGQVFRVDLRLRPQGASGEMVAGCAQALRYYRGVAHDWELQSLLKLRASAGDSTLAEEFVEQVQGLIYCNELSLSAIRTAAESMERIQRAGARQGSGEVDVKNGAGGLREIEFVAQCLQRVHGGGERWLRSSGTLFALQKLHDKGHIGDAEFRELGAAYVLLRTIEHRLQCRQGVQAHRLPKATQEQAALLGSLGVPEADSVEKLRQIMTSASGLCARVLRLGSRAGTEAVTAQSLNLGASGADRLRGEVARRSAVLAKVLEAGAGATLANTTLANLQRFLAAASTGEDRVRGALENIEWIEGALPVFAQSALATAILVRHPEDIYALFGECKRAAGAPVPEQLRIDARRCNLRLVGRTILQAAPLWETLREYSQCYDGIVQMGLDAAEAPEGFAVFAVGRLGTCELDVLSDADLVFVRSAECNAEAAERCARSLVAMLSGYTREGSVIVVDTRIRPHGGEGELVSSTRQLAQYFESDAKAWETLAFGKLRWIAGDRRLESDVAAAVLGLRRRFATPFETPIETPSWASLGTPSGTSSGKSSGEQAGFIAELRAMRKRIADSGGADSFRSGPGGMFDLDFLVGMLEARALLPTAGKQLPERLEALQARNLVTAEQARILLPAAELFRRVDHANRLVEGRTRKWLPASDGLRASVEKMVGAPELGRRLREVMKSVRAIFNLYFDD
jgi:glutamate-ammonia-ligase adenylyltransferase